MGAISRLGFVVLAITVAIVGWRTVLAVAAVAPDVSDRPALSVPESSTPELIEAAVATGELERSIADLYLAYAIGNDPRLPARFTGTSRWSGTLVQASLLKRSVFARGLGRTLGTTSLAQVARYANVAAITSHTCNSSFDGSQVIPDAITSPHFYVEYDASQVGGGLVISDYLSALETSWSTEITSFGFITPPVKFVNPPPGGKYFVRINGLSQGLYAITSDTGDYGGDPDGDGIFNDDNPNSPWVETHARASCIVLNQNFGLLSPLHAREAMSATVAHEFFHAVQYGIGAISAYDISNSTRDVVLIEGSTTAIEDEVMDDSNDNVRSFAYPDFAQCLADDEKLADAYRSWIRWRAMIEPFGHLIAGGSEQILQDFYEASSRNLAVSHMDALNQAYANKGATLAGAVHNAAIALKFMRSCNGSYIHPTCLVEAASYVSAHGIPPVNATVSSVGDSVTGSAQDNYGTSWIQLPNVVTGYQLTVTNSSAGGKLRGSLVCDTGGTLAIQALPDVLAAGQAAVVNVIPRVCSPAVLVVTNESQTASAPSSCAARSFNVSTAPTNQVGVPTATQIPTGVRVPHFAITQYLPMVTR